jgi:hypothetical protein
MSRLPFAVERTADTVVTLRFDDLRSGDERWILCRTDAHHENIGCDQKLEKKHLEEARDRDAAILDGGDLLDLMDAGGGDDKRANKLQLQPELRKSDKPYVSALIDYVSGFYEPYALNWALLAPGNHETAFIKRREIDMTAHLGERLKAKGSPVEVGGYQGWVRFMFKWRKNQASKRLWYHHGWGGASPATKGVGHTQRQMAYLGNADFILNGHTHNSYWVTDVQHSLDKNGKPVFNNVECLRCPGYKREFDNGNGWAVEKGHGPRVLGAWWLRFYLEDDQIQYEIRQAK